MLKGTTDGGARDLVCLLPPPPLPPSPPPLHATWDPTRCHGSHIWSAFSSCSKASGVYLKLRLTREREREHLNLVLGFETWLPLDCSDCQFKNISISLLPLCPSVAWCVASGQALKCGGFLACCALMATGQRRTNHVGYPNGWMDGLCGRKPVHFISYSLSFKCPLSIHLRWCMKAAAAYVWLGSLSLLWRTLFDIKVLLIGKCR